MTGQLEPPPRVPHVTSQPPSVDFIENHLPKYHKAFSNQYCRYDAEIQCFVPRREISANLLSHDSNAPAAGSQVLPPRQLMPAVAAMDFWAHILPDAMKMFLASVTEEPELFRKKGYSIRDKHSWDDIYAQLQLAREHYDGNKKGFWGKVKSGYRRAYRTAADNSGILGQALKALPDQDLVSPVKAVLEVLLDATRVAVSTRGKLTSAFNEDALEKTFGDIEIFLAVFQGDDNIIEASVDLLATTLRAVENTMAFFLSHQARRIFRALAEGDDYMKALLDCIVEIDQKSQELIREAERSETVGNRVAMEQILQGMGQLVFLELNQGAKVEFVSGKVDSVLGELSEVKQLVVSDTAARAEWEARITNKMDKLLSDGANSREQELGVLELAERVKTLEMDRELNLRLQAEVLRLREENEKFRAQAIPTGSVQNHPQAQPLWTHSFWQIPHAPFLPQPLPWPQYCLPQPRQTSSSPNLDVATLISHLASENLDISDVEYILETSDALEMRHRTLISQIVGTNRFHNWSTSFTSCRLLVQGSVSRDSRQSVSALSWFCALLVNTLRKRELFISLVFFCGQHTEADDTNSGVHSMMRSLITQLLQQQEFLQIPLTYEEFDGESGGHLHLEMLCQTFSLLLRQIPKRMTLVIVLDNVGLYENVDHEVDLLKVMGLFESFVQDQSIPPAVKILATSSTKTLAVHRVFEDDTHDDETWLLATSELPPVGDNVAISDLEDMQRDGTDV